MIHYIKKQNLIIPTIIFSLTILSVIIFTFSIDKNTNIKIIKYIESIGWKVEQNPKEISYYKIPVKFNEVFNTYNNIQQKAGFDMSKYKGKNVVSYSYKIINHKYSDSNSVYATILLYKGEIIGGEISLNKNPCFIYEINNTKDLISS